VDWRCCCSCTWRSREGDDRNLQDSGNDPPECCPGKPCCSRRQQAHGCQRHLHDGSPVIARGKFSRSYFYSAFHSGRMFDEAEVDGGSCEQAAREHTNEFGNLTHQLQKTIWSVGLTLTT